MPDYLKRSFKGIAESLNGDYLAILKHNIKEPMILHTYEDSWISRYVDQNYWKNDPALKPFSRCSYTVWGKHDSQSKIIQEAREFAIRSGVSFELTSANQNRYTVTVASQYELKDWLNHFRLNDLIRISSMGYYIDNLDGLCETSIREFTKKFHHSRDLFETTDQLLNDTQNMLKAQQVEIETAIPQKINQTILSLNQFANDLIEHPLLRDVRSDSHEHGSSKQAGKAGSAF